MKRERFSLPSERPPLGDDRSKALHSGMPLLAVLSIPPIAGYVWRGCVWGDWGWGIVGLAVCAGATITLWHGLIVRSIDCNQGVYHRYEQPVRYWCIIGTLFAFYLFATAAFFVPGS